MALPDLGVANSLRPGSGWNLVFTQQVGQAAAGTTVQAERTGVRVYAAFGVSLGNPPSPQSVVNALIAKGVAHQVYYMEAYEQDHVILGTGYRDYAYLAVYS
jgi:hypothetical protein